MRPIVPCTKWITTPASVLADHLLQSLLHKGNITWIVKDTKSFVNELEHTHLTPRAGILITADIASLYTNIDTTMGLSMVHSFLQEQQVPSYLCDLIMDLLTFVMRYSYLSFKNVVYHQIDGTAMGTAVAPTYANIVVYMLERKVISEFGDNIYLYRRFLDDIFAYVSPSCASDFQKRMNELHPKLRFEFSSDNTEAAFLDLTITKGQRFHTDGRFDLSVHQKKMNLYLYIPFKSYHTNAAKRSFILTELMRYIRNSSDQDSYVRLKHIFFQRLRDRGYPATFLLPIFNNIYWSDRNYFLYDSEAKAPLHSHPDIHRRPPESQCLIRRLHRSRLQALTNTPHHPPVFIIPYTPLSHRVPTRDILSDVWWMLPTILNLPKPIIAYQSCPSLVMRLVYQKARILQKQQEEQSKSKKMIQPKLLFPRNAIQQLQRLPDTIPMELSSQ